MNIEFEIPNDAITHLKEQSVYNDNYYKIDRMKLNKEWFYSSVCDIIREECDEFANRYTLTFGYFLDYGNNLFVDIFSFDSPYGIYELKKRRNWYED
jgi:hypothetical protein